MERTPEEQSQRITELLSIYPNLTQDQAAEVERVEMQIINGINDLTEATGGISSFAEIFSVLCEKPTDKLVAEVIEELFTNEATGRTAFWDIDKDGSSLFTCSHLEEL